MALLALLTLASDPTATEEALAALSTPEEEE